MSTDPAAIRRSSYLAGIEDALWAQHALSFRPDKDLPPAPERAPHRAGPRVIFAGFPSEFSLAFLLALAALEVDIVALLTSPGAHPAVRRENALSRIASHLDVPLLRAWDVNGHDTCRELTRLNPDAVVMASFDQIVGPATLAIPRCGWLNVHPSALPAYRGPEPIYWTLAEGAPIAGVTLHRVVARLDAGPILAQQTFPVASDETAGTLTYRASRAGTRLLADALHTLLAGSPGRVPDLTCGSYRSSIGRVNVSDAATAVDDACSQDLVEPPVDLCPGRVVRVAGADQAFGLDPPVLVEDHHAGARHHRDQVIEGDVEQPAARALGDDPGELGRSPSRSSVHHGGAPIRG